MTVCVTDDKIPAKLWKILSATVSMTVEDFSNETDEDIKECYCLILYITICQCWEDPCYTVNHQFPNVICLIK
jgi:hypothetical protein